MARLPLFDKPADYDAFERVLLEALKEHPIRLLSYCLMPNIGISSSGRGTTAR